MILMINAFLSSEARLTDKLSPAKTNGATLEGDHPCYIAPLFVTLCSTPVPTRNGRAYVPQSSRRAM